MGTATLTARLPLRIRARRGTTATCGLAFDLLGGPLVAVCALVGGSGASTLALSLARQAARESSAPILLTEADPARAGLAALAGHASPLCLLALAQDVADGRAPARPWVQSDHGLRLIASTPHPVTPAEPTVLRALLRDARAAHGLVVVDCGTAWPAARPVLDQATHILWTLPATKPAIARARFLLDSAVPPPPGRSRELLLALALERSSRASVRELRRLAAPRCERLVLTAHSDALAQGETPTAEKTLSRTLTALAPTLHRRP